MPFIDSLPAKREVFEHWRHRIGELGFFIDWGEPSCWACGFHYSDKYDIRKPDASLEEIYRCWDKIPLQRCHIVPKSLGGTDECDNLFLMCRECHDLAPNTSIPEIFYEWARAQSSYVREAQKIKTALRSFGVEEQDHDKYCAFMNAESFRGWLDGKMGLHRPQSNYAPTSARLTPATMVGLLIYYARNNGVEL
ncbi:MULTISPECIES: HNH endonuclease [unclassified Halomonas]|uniref:HNH endonuclease n=1 Tax=unclassified Halomonas TaxID=2609666 RepID=UPI001CF58834|nr:MULTISPECIES: HNH endonuclease [unclassified Halomonas]UZH08191.1 HNH endonuclease [Halomonas sp. BDJS001]